MESNKNHLQWLYLLSVFFFVIGFAESRYIKNEETANEISNQNQNLPLNPPDDDVDLEEVFEDYYDYLWQLLETSIENSEKNKKKKKQKEEAAVKPKFGDYDYMSDMAVAEPEVDSKKYKNFFKDLSTVEKKNFTWSSVNGSGFNGSFGDSQIPDAVRANRESSSEEEFAQRSKEMRIKSIKDLVLSFRGGNPKSNGTVPNGKHYNALREIYEKNLKFKNEDWTSSYMEKVQSFYPSCDVPRNTDEDVWSDPFSMNLLFDLEYPTPQEDSTIMIVTAKLRLYKLMQENFSASHMESSTNKTKMEKTQNNFAILPNDDDKQIRVSVYWYTKSLRRHRVKRKLLDSQMLSAYAPKWTEFNIRPAVRTWKDSGRNFGLVVTVEDEDGTLLPAEQYIHSMNCSRWTATVRPIPSILIDRANQYFIENVSENKNETVEEGKSDEEKHKIYPYQPLFYPIIDLRTREVPKSDVNNLFLVDSARMALEFNFWNSSRRGVKLGNSSFTIYMKDENLYSRDPSNYSKLDRSTVRKSDSKNGGEFRVSYFQNTPIGSPASYSNRGLPGKRDEYEAKVRSEIAKAEDDRGEDREMPRIRHSRKQ